MPPIDLHNISIDSPGVIAWMWSRATNEQAFYGATALSWIMQEMNKHINYDKDDLEYLVKNNAVVPQNRAAIIQTGLFIGLKGDYYAALHILIPQTENIYRNIAKMCGATTYTLEDDNSSQAKTLGSIFKLPELVDSYDEDILFWLRGLLDEKAGSNLRNRIAHGLLNPCDANNGIGQYFLSLFIKILLWTSAHETPTEN